MAVSRTGCCSGLPSLQKYFVSILVYGCFGHSCHSFLSCGSKRQCEFVAFVLASAIAVHYLLMDASLGEENMSVLGFHGLLSGSLERFTSRSMSPSTLNHINLLGGVQEEKGVWRAAERR
ncbi:hypothetical protein BHE74_00001986 [Ensete ventricosum]|nr:hypothetical protein BHE74_00001986 [Ensete ventricosum]